MLHKILFISLEVDKIDLDKILEGIVIIVECIKMQKVGLHKEDFKLYHNLDSVVIIKSIVVVNNTEEIEIIVMISSHKKDNIIRHMIINNTAMDKATTVNHNKLISIYVEVDRDNQKETPLSTRIINE